MKLELNILNSLKEKIKWDSITKINSGYDPCLKFCVYKANKKYLLKIFDKNNLIKKQREYNILSGITDFPFLRPSPIEFGEINNDYHYFLLTWVEGESLESYFKRDSNIDLYSIGCDIGNSIYKFHCYTKMNKSIDIISNIKSKLEKYKEANLNLKDDDVVLSYIYNNIHKLEKQPVSLIHGDLTETNIIINSENQIGLIDFGNACINYSYYDLHQVQMYNRFFSVDLSVGIIDGYIKNVKDKDFFWECFKIYNAYLSLYKVVWAQKYGKEEIENMKNRYYQTLIDYNLFKNQIPKWYTEYKSNI